jgi:prolipoprotein diacylglyceryltransferase
MTNSSRISPFQICAGIGLAVCLTQSMVLTAHQGLSIHVTVVLACAGLLAFLVLTMITKIIIGEEVLIYYHDEIAVLVTAAAILYATGLPLLPYLDISVLAVGTLLAFGRLGCFMVGCCHGKPSRWGVVYRAEHAHDGFPRYLVGVPLFPIPLVECVWVFATVLGGIWLVANGAPAGEALAWYTTVYGAGRFLFEFFRGDTGRPHRVGFSEAQWTSLVLMTANAAAEISGLLPVRTWQLGVTAAVPATMIVLSLRNARERRMFQAAHIREIAELIAAARSRTAVTGEIHLGRTGLGIQLSASEIVEGPRHVEVIAFSSCGEELSGAAAARLARLIGRLRGCGDGLDAVREARGVYRLIVPRRGRSAYAV